MNLTTTDSLATGFPLVIATQTQQPTARLQLRNFQGQVIQQWLVKSNKCTLGSAVSCSLRCELPGIAPYHALLVIGARQIFIRALAPKLTRDGQPFNELLLTDADSHFELAGHRFELSRHTGEAKPMSRVEAASPQRIKFTLARPFELRNRPQAAPITHVDSVQRAAEMISTGRSGGDSKWVAQMIQAALQPLECQLHNLAEPLNELQRESRKLRRVRKRQSVRKRQTVDLHSDMGSDTVLQQTPGPIAQQAQLAEQVEAIVVKHSAAMEVLTERVSEANQQLRAIERIVAEQRHASQVEEAQAQAVHESPQVALQSEAIEQLQHSVVSVSSVLERLQAEQATERADDQQWKDGLQLQLASLAQVMKSLSASVVEVHDVALRAASQPAEAQHIDYQPQSIADSSPVSAWPPATAWQANSSLQADSDALNTSDAISESFPSAAEAWGQASVEFDLPAPSSEQPMWSAFEADEANADLASDTDENRESGPMPLAELPLPTFEPEQPMWTALEPADASAQPPTDTDVNDDTGSGDIADSSSTSLPSWWADDEPESELSDRVAVDQFATPHENHDSKHEVEISFHSDERIVEETRDVDDWAWASSNDFDERRSEGVVEVEPLRVSEADSRGVGPEKEFFDPAQIALEERIQAADSKSLTPMPIDHEPHVALDDVAFQSPGGQPQGQATPTVASQYAGDLEDQLLGCTPPDAVKSGAGLSEPIAGEAAIAGEATDGDEAAVGDQGTVGDQATVGDQGTVGDQATVGDQGTVGEEHAAENEENDSVEEYMRKLLARMRGVPEEEVDQQHQSAVKSPEAAPQTHVQSITARAGDDSSMPLVADHLTLNYPSDNIDARLDVTEAFDPEKYMPRALAPERSSSLAAMRELANSSARTAIHKSTRQRHVSSIALKSLIACVGLMVGMVLLAINGLSLNIGLVATVASFLVAAIWGYDSISSIRPMLQNGLVLKPQAGSPQASPEE